MADEQNMIDALDPNKKPKVQAGQTAPPGGDLYSPAGLGAGGAAPPAGVPGGTTQPPPTTTPPPPTADPFAAMGGGEYFADTGQWIPKNNEPALQAARARTGQTAPPPPPQGPVNPPALPVGDPPPADPTSLPPDFVKNPPALPLDPNTPIQGAGSGGVTPSVESGQQKMLRDALLAQMGQSKDVSVNDPNIKAQLDPYAAAQERARHEEVSRGAEQAFANQQDYGAPERMAVAERAGQATGLRASDLVGREVQAKRDEIQKALTEFGGVMSEDQKNALTRRAQDLDAQLKREGIGADVYKTDKSYSIEKYKTDRGFDMDKMRLDADTIIKQAGLKQTGDLANRELDIRDKLGMAGMNAQMTGMLLQDKQFRQKLGLDAGIAEADLNRQALTSLMG